MNNPKKDKPTVYLIAGQICSGKTTVAKILESITGAVRFTADEWMLKLYPKYVERENFDEIFFRCCDLSWQVAEEFIKRGIDIILDFGFWKRRERDKYKELINEKKAKVKLIYVFCKDAIIRERLLLRNQNLPKGVFYLSIDDYNFFSVCFEEPQIEERHFLIDNTESNTIKQQLTNILQ